MDIRRVILGSIAVLLLASFIPEIVTLFNTAENTTGASTSLTTGLNISQIVLGIAAAIVVLDMVGIKITSFVGSGGGGRRRRR